MAQLTTIMRLGDEELRIKNITLKELLQIKSWTGFANKQEWRVALASGDPEAIQAAYGLAVWRKSGALPKIADLDFDTDEMETFTVDETGRRVGVDLEMNKDGSVKTTKEGQPVPKLQPNGDVRLIYLDDDNNPTGESVPPTATP